MIWLKKWAAAAVVVMAFGLMIAVGLARGIAKPTEPPAKPPGGDPPAALNDQPREVKQSIRVVVKDPDGKPLQGASIHTGIWTNQKDFNGKSDYTTDSNGIAIVKLPSQFTILRLWVSHKPFVRLFANWEQGELASLKTIPDEYTFKMEPAVSVGGQVVDEDGKPVEGAVVSLYLSGDTKQSSGDGRTKYDVQTKLKTNVEGRWRFDQAPNARQATFMVQVNHPNFLTFAMGNRREDGSAFSFDDFRAERVKLTLKRGVVVRGRVEDSNGKPIENAIVIFGDEPYFSNTPCKFPTDAAGKFVSLPMNRKPISITVHAPGHAPQMIKLDLAQDQPEQVFRLTPGKAVRLRIVDEAGRPIPKARVDIVSWKGIKSLETLHNPNHPPIPDRKIPTYSDDEGRWVWDSAPDEAVTLQVEIRGATQVKLAVSGGAAEQTVVMKSDPRIAGRVIDAVTGRPISQFTVVPMNLTRKDMAFADRLESSPGSRGQFVLIPKQMGIPLKLRIEAHGYRTLDGQEFQSGDPSARIQEFRLQPSKPLAGTIVDVEGRPAAKVEVLLATPTQVASLSEAFNNRTTATDSSGRFEFPDPGESVGLIARSDSGFAMLQAPAGQLDLGKVTLRPWTSVRGTFRDGGKPIAGASIGLELIRHSAPGQPWIDARLTTLTDSAGRYEFARVPPVPVAVGPILGPWSDPGYRAAPKVPLDLQDGKPVSLNLGTDGAIVSGRVQLTGKLPAGLDCTYSINWLIARSPGIKPPTEISNLGFDIRQGLKASWMTTLEGKAYVSCLNHWFVKLAPDGSFRISGVPAGEYDLCVSVYVKPDGCLVSPVAHRVVRVAVTKQDVGRGTLSIDKIEAEVQPTVEAGATPELSFKNADNRDGKLSEFRGRYTLVHFWAGWCQPCKQQIPQLKAVRNQFTPDRLNILSLSIDDDMQSWQAAAKRLTLEWPQGLLTGEGAARIGVVPAYWLLDRDGKVVAVVNTIDEAGKLLNERIK